LVRNELDRVRLLVGPEDQHTMSSAAALGGFDPATVIVEIGLGGHWWIGPKGKRPRSIRLRQLWILGTQELA
jgi:hypothetical protein